MDQTFVEIFCLPGEKHFMRMRPDEAILWLPRPGPSPVPLSVVPRNFIHTLDSFPLLTVPLFMPAAELPNK